MTKSGFQEFDHTADAGLRISGKSLEELFINAARGMFALLLPNQDRDHLLSGGEKDQTEILISATASEISLLLREWLGELLYHYSAERIFFTDFFIEAIDETQVQGLAIGTRFTPELEAHLTEIKAVTYHELRVFQQADGYHASVIFDI